MNPPVKNTLEGLGRGEAMIGGLIMETIGPASGIPHRRIEGIVLDTQVGLKAEMSANAVMRKARQGGAHHKDGMIPFMGKHF